MKFIGKSSMRMIFLSVFFILSCTSKIKIQSDPGEAEVFVSQQNSLDRRSLGKTPLELNYTDLLEKAGGTPKTGDFVLLTFQAKDFETEKVLLPVPVLGTLTSNLNVKLQNSTERKENLAKEILGRVHNAQKFAQAGNFERALIEVDKVLELDPTFVRGLSLKGSIYYLQKNYKEALSWFEKALAADNSFDEAVKMINKIKSEMNPSTQNEKKP